MAELWLRCVAGHMVPCSPRATATRDEGLYFSQPAAGAAPAAGDAAGRPLTSEQVRAYVRDGFLLVDGLVPPAVVAAAEAVLWDAMAGVVPTCAGDPYASDRKSVSRAEVEAGGVRPGAPSHTGGWVGILQHPAILAVVTPDYVRAAEQLGTALHRRAGRPAETDWAERPARMLALNTLPALPGTEWAHPEGHTVRWPTPCY
jgi:hypothetical protein